MENKINLYKVDSKGRERILSLWTVGHILYSESGIVGGKLKIDQRQCSPKNVGKINSTTGEQQAIAEMHAKYTKKLKEGYSSSLEEAKKAIVIMPMLAKTFNKEKHKIDWNGWVVAQQKLDGMRALIFVEDEIVIMSRTGRKITTMVHIENMIKSLNLPKGTILDGELYLHGLSFQENMKLIKKIRPDSVTVRFYVYDIIKGIGNRERNKVLDEIFDKYVHNTDLIQRVQSYPIKSEEDLKHFHKKCIEQGYEGTMVRWGDEPYKINGRSSHLLKNKDFLDMKVKIVSVVASEARPTEGILLCKLENGKQFKATPKCSRKSKENILSNKQDWEGREVEVRYFELTDDNIPRFPVAMVIL